MPEKIYTEAEFTALLGRAARLQADRGPSGHEGLTLDEIKAAAAEAGIEPRFVEMAASAASDHRPAYWSIPTGAGRSLAVRGSLTDERWSRMVAEFTRSLGGPGESDVEGARRTWSRGSLRVTAQEGGGEVVLHAETEWGKELELPIALTLVGAVAAGTTAAVALVSLEWTIGVVAALLTLLVAGSFAAYRRRTAARQERLGDTLASTLDRCAAMLHDETATPGRARSDEIEGRTAQRIALPDAEPEEQAPPRAARRLRNQPPNASS